MDADRAIAAIDLGAASGRVVVGRVASSRLEFAEVHRFANEPLRLSTGLHWDIGGLFRETLTGLALAQRHAGPIASIGVDSWAVDFGLLDADGALIGNPHHYRDDRAATGVAIVDGLVEPSELYARTGIQHLPFNTIYQLAAASATGELATAQTMLLIPDLIGYWLSGVTVTERTNASATALVDVAHGSWADDLIARVGVPRHLFTDFASPGQVIGSVRAEVAAETGLPADAKVTLPATHDTASAVVALPVQSERFAYISCGTWALAGLELDAPLVSEETRGLGFTNELGVDGRVRFLHNVMGLWLVQESMRSWQRDGLSLDIEELLAKAAALPPGGPTIDPDDPSFMPPGNMPARVAEACRRSGQRVPANPAALVRCIIDSLALTFAETLREAARLTKRPIDVVHLVGGGSRNALLCQLTADASGLPVMAGPAEATALGNLLVQARAHGLIGPGLQVMRDLIRNTQPLALYEPRRQLNV